MSDRWRFSYGDDSRTSPDSPDESTSLPRTGRLSPEYERALDRPRRSTSNSASPRGPGERFRRERERIHSGTSKRDLVKALVDEEYESKQTRRVLYKAYDKFQRETNRANGAESRALEAAQRYRRLNEDRILAEHEATRLREELRLYKLQLENAQNEIHKAQDVLRVVEEQRDEAEAAAARARDTARRLNEVRLVEQAREEGRRLGFEEGIRRGREIGFDEGRNLGYEDGRTEMRGIATNAMDRILGDQEQGTYNDAEYDQPDAPTGAPLHQHQTGHSPDVIRVPSPPPKDRTSSTRRRRNSVSSSHHTGLSNSRAQVLTPLSLPLSPPIRPFPVQNQPRSPRHPDVQLPPDGWIPTADQADYIAMPPPHELQHTPGPTDADSIISRPPQSEPSPAVRTRNFAFEPQQRDVPPRPTSLDSQGSTNHSKASTSVSQMDLVSPPHITTGRNGRRAGLSVIPEDTSAQPSPNASIRDRSVNSDYRVPFPPLQGPDFSAFASDRGTDSPAQLMEARVRDKRLNQRMADELRYSDPKQVEEWRRNGADENRSTSSRDAPPRRRPSNVTVPEPLSPSGFGHSHDRLFDSPNSRHKRAHSLTSASSQSLNVPGHNGHYRQSTSSGSSVPEITIQPPSRPSSDHHDPPVVGASHLLSPDHAHRALPPVDYSTSTRADPNHPLVPTVPNSPVIPNHIFEFLPDGNLPPGFTPTGQSSPLPPLDVPQTGSTIPIPIPPPFSSSYFSSGGPSPAPTPVTGMQYPSSPSNKNQELQQPIPTHSSLYSDIPRSSSAMGNSSRSRTPWSNIYATAVNPPGATYPQATGMTASLSGGPYGRISWGNQATTNSPGHRRSISLNAGQSPTGTSRSKNLPPAAPFGPASESFRRDSVTQANTFANAGGSRSSSALSYV